MVYGDGMWAPGQETPGMCARRLRAGVCVGSIPSGVLGAGGAGQGAHREVGSEGFAANHRAVAEQGEPVGQSPGETEPALRRRRKYLECLGASRCVRAARWDRSMRYPGRSRTVRGSTGSGTWAYKPSGEVAGDAVREVGVTRGTHEPGKSKSPGTTPIEGWRGGDPKGAVQGEGVTSGDGEPKRHAGEYASIGLMVAAAMTETMALRRPADPGRGVR